MAEERKDSFAETVDTAASAAHTVKGAIKAGKAISGAAKGAAAGGPYGAVAGAVWAGRKHIGKIITVIIILLLLPDQRFFAGRHGAACPQQRNCNRGERQRHHFYHQLHLG